MTKNVNAAQRFFMLHSFEDSNVEGRLIVTELVRGKAKKQRSRLVLHAQGLGLNSPFTERDGLPSLTPFYNDLYFT